MNWFVKAMTSVVAPFFAVLFGIILVGTGLGLWIHPGLGMASAGVVLVWLGKLLGNE